MSQNHVIDFSHNGSSLTINAGDTLTVKLQGDYSTGRARTAWTFGDRFDFQPVLALGTMETSDALRRMEFSAQAVGEGVIALHEYYVLGIPGPSNVARRFHVKVNVVQG